jgi:hypothetical protein
MDILLSTGAIQLVEPGSVGLSIFERLVVGSGGDALGDGEAAAIGLAVELGGIVALDEQRATRICAENFAAIGVVSSGSLFSHENVLKSLGEKRLAEAVYNALLNTNMSVHDDHFDWVISQISSEKAANCISLSKQLRSWRRGLGK